MKQNNDFAVRKILSIAILLCLTSFLAVLTLFNFKTYVIKYNNQSVIIKTVPSISQSKLFELADIDSSLVEITNVDSSMYNLTELTVFDTFTVNVNVDGQTFTTQTAPTTLKNVLTELGVTLDSDDIISVSLDSILKNETDVNITRVSYIESYQTEYLEYQTIKRESSKLDYGDTQVLVEGEIGEKRITIETVLYDGEIFSSQVISEQILKEPVNNIVEYGTFNVNRGVTHREGVITTETGEMLTYAKVIEGTATAYSAEMQSSKTTKSGTIARVGAIAVDPRVIPLGSELYITSADGTSWVYGVAVAEDTGSAIIGNIVDLYFETVQECISFGRKACTIYVLS